MYRKFLAICFLSSLFFACNRSNTKVDQVATKNSDSVVKNQTSAKNSNEKKIQKPRSLEEEIKVIEDALLVAEQNEDHNKKGVNFMKLANLHHEKSGDLRAAIFNAARSVSSFEMALDTSQTANMLKYQASLQAANGDFELAISTADRAIAYYEAVDFDRGIASMHLNKAQTYLAQKEYSKSEEFYLSSVEYLKDMANKNTLFLYHLHGLKLFKEAEEKGKYSKLVKDCKRMIDSEKIRPNLLNQFENIVNN